MRVQRRDSQDHWFHLRQGRLEIYGSIRRPFCTHNFIFSETTSCARPDANSLIRKAKSKVSIAAISKQAQRHPPPHSSQRAGASSEFHQVVKLPERCRPNRCPEVKAIDVARTSIVERIIHRVTQTGIFFGSSFSAAFWAASLSRRAFSKTWNTSLSSSHHLRSRPLDQQ